MCKIKCEICYYNFFCLLYLITCLKVWPQNILLDEGTKVVDQEYDIQTNFLKIATVMNVLK